MTSTSIKQEPAWDWSSVDSQVRHRTGPDIDSTAPVKAESNIKQEYQEPFVQEDDQEEDGPPPEYWESEEYFGGPNSGLQPEAEYQEQPYTTRSWPSRTCRICLETIAPTLHTSDALPGFMARKPRVTYISEDPELGRLIRPCKCKGSSRYVHEGCLQRWRITNPFLNSKNYWTCPTCQFNYKFSRMTWGRIIKSSITQVSLTLIIFITTIFLLGFVADPIINFYLDPIDTILDRFEGDSGYRDDEDSAGWISHLIKGVASLGLIGAMKTFLSLSPWTQWSYRNAFSSGGRAGRTGRDRLSSVTWMLIISGIVTFLWVSFRRSFLCMRLTNAWSRRYGKVFEHGLVELLSRHPIK